ncbi:alpha/beta fold hydrolase [Paraburkholderia sp. J8-2]|uniref:alpha/beta fold hydrolase n=1 Tax=Paraburkholderia sp. J8-2 TaxID=2805440 RepID=UPI002AB798AF|nr:alpha/beta fold hydrolase [Paraburkholderia sp. J8-2]
MNTFTVDDRGNILRYIDMHCGTSTFDPLVFIHGLGCASSSDYPPVVTSRSYSKCRSILVDLMGAGFSDKPEDGTYTSTAQAAVLEKFVAAEPFTQVNLFAHSAGAFIALKLAKWLPGKLKTLILCAPGLTDYGIARLSEMASTTEAEFVNGGFAQLRAQLRAEGGNDAWLGPFAVASPHALYQWAKSALEDNSGSWLEDLARLNTRKGVILPDTATREDIARFERAGCSVELVANAEHMMAYDNPDGLVLAIGNVLKPGTY